MSPDGLWQVSPESVSKVCLYHLKCRNFGRVTLKEIAHWIEASGLSIADNCGGPDCVPECSDGPS
jgi:hypothetical protein